MSGMMLKLTIVKLEDHAAATNNAARDGDVATRRTSYKRTRTRLSKYEQNCVHHYIVALQNLVRVKSATSRN